MVREKEREVMREEKREMRERLKKKITFSEKHRQTIIDLRLTSPFFMHHQITIDFQTGRRISSINNANLTDCTKKCQSNISYVLNYRSAYQQINNQDVGS